MKKIGFDMKRDIAILKKSWKISDNQLCISGR